MVTRSPPHACPLLVGRPGPRPGVVRRSAGLGRRAPPPHASDALHGADSQSVALFERLAEPRSGPRLIVGTSRPEALPRRHPIADLLPRLERRRAVTHLHLDRLTPSDVSAFLAAVYGRAPSF